MKVKPFKEEVVALVVNFLSNSLKETVIAEQLKLKYLQHVPEWVLKNNMLVRKGLVKVVKSYVQVNQKVK
jgi:hypothetical protein